MDRAIPPSRPAGPPRAQVNARERCRNVWCADARECHRRMLLVGACCGFAPAAYALSEDHSRLRAVLHDAFALIDADGSGELDMDEINAWFAAVKVVPEMSALDIRNAKKVIDLDRNGTVSFGELWMWWKAHDPPLKIHALNAAGGAQSNTPRELTTAPLDRSGTDDEDDEDVPTISQAVRHNIELLTHWSGDGSGGGASVFSRACLCWNCTPTACGPGCEPFCERACCDRFSCLLWRAYVDPLRTIGENASVEMGVYFSNFAFTWGFLTLCLVFALAMGACNVGVSYEALMAPQWGCERNATRVGIAQGDDDPLTTGELHYDVVAECCTNNTQTRVCLEDRTLQASTVVVSLVFYLLKPLTFDAHPQLTPVGLAPPTTIFVTDSAWLSFSHRWDPDAFVG